MEVLQRLGTTKNDKSEVSCGERRDFEVTEFNFDVSLRPKSPKIRYQYKVKSCQSH